jgi:hypothetical protein
MLSSEKKLVALAFVPNIVIFIILAVFFTLYYFMLRASYIDKNKDCESKKWARGFGWFGVVVTGLGLLMVVGYMVLTFAITRNALK